MSIDEAEAWIRAQMADPAKKARLEAYYADHPMLSDQAQAEMWELERDLFNLLERDDADALYLSPEEVNPWLPILLELLAPVEAQAQQATERGEPDVSELRSGAYLMDILAIIGIVAAIIGIPAAIVQVPGEKLKSPPQNCSAIPGRRQMGRARFKVFQHRSRLNRLSDQLLP